MTRPGHTPRPLASRVVAMLRLAVPLALVVALAAAVLFTSGGAAAWDGAASSTDWSGAGTATDPYLIADAAQLKGLADGVNGGTTYAGAFFTLGADIDLGNAAWDPIGGACPLGVDGVPTGHFFAGALDGGNHTISGLNVSGPAAGTVGYHQRHGSRARGRCGGRGVLRLGRWAGRGPVLQQRRYPSYDRFLWASADSSPVVHITDCFWLTAASDAT